ncbi:MAG: 8-oxo-dGTP diphosphatase [Lachnospiraceae bacterium]|nr:8-oxo-dGTP diphosphatase [Lachnospiraceae bacterium]
MEDRIKQPVLTTLCYIEKDDKYLMLHRIKKEQDLNKDKYIGVGGHFEYGESPDECLKREVYEETGLTLLSYKPRGIITFIYGQESGGEERIVEYMYLYTATEFEGTLTDCDEGELEWIDKVDVYKLPIWEGDRIFFRLLEERSDFFSLKLVYSKTDELILSEIN